MSVTLLGITLPNPELGDSEHIEANSITKFMEIIDLVQEDFAPKIRVFNLRFTNIPQATVESLESALILHLENGTTQVYVNPQGTSYNGAITSPFTFRVHKNGLDFGITFESVE